MRASSAASGCARASQEVNELFINVLLEVRTELSRLQQNEAALLPASAQAGSSTSEGPKSAAAPATVQPKKEMTFFTHTLAFMNVQKTCALAIIALQKALSTWGFVTLLAGTLAVLPNLSRIRAHQQQILVFSTFRHHYFAGN